MKKLTTWKDTEKLIEEDLKKIDNPEITEYEFWEIINRAIPPKRR